MNNRIKKKKLSQKIDRIRKTTLNKGDTIIINCRELTEVDTMREIKEYFQDKFPNNNTIIIQKGFDISIIEEV